MEHQRCSTDTHDLNSPFSGLMDPKQVDTQASGTWRGKVVPSRREEKVLSLPMQDTTAQQIEDTLCASNSTVKSHTHAVYQKIGVQSRSELIEKLEAPSRP